ncbi:hypothetical protein AKJ16_DCAP07053, partial [Drosera capensis]
SPRTHHWSNREYLISCRSDPNPNQRPTLPSHGGSPGVGSRRRRPPIHLRHRHRLPLLNSPDIHPGARQLRPRPRLSSLVPRPLDPGSEGQDPSVRDRGTVAGTPRSFGRLECRAPEPIERSLHHTRAVNCVAINKKELDIGLLVQLSLLLIKHAWIEEFKILAFITSSCASIDIACNFLQFCDWFVLIGEQAQQREIKLQEENAAFERVISDCEYKIQERLLEASLLQEKLKEMDIIEADLRAELANVEAAATSKSEQHANSFATEVGAEAKDKSESALLGELEMKKELHSMEEIVQELEQTWQEVQDKALKQPSPAQREKALDKQLHGLIEQLAMKQTQAEGLVAEIHTKEKELDRLNSLWKQLQNGNAEMNAARNRRSSSGNLYANGVHGYEKLPYHAGGQFLTPQRLRLLRSSFVLYVFLLHFIVFVKISL